MIGWGSRIVLVTVLALSLGSFAGCSTTRPASQSTQTAAITGTFYGAGDALGWRTFGKQRRGESLPPLAIVEVEP